MDKNNSIHTYGNNNTLLQDITARDINIFTGKKIDPKIINKKEVLIEKFVELIKQLADLTPKEAENSTNNKTNSEEFDEIEWDEIIEYIQAGTCVLFIGQDIATDENNHSLHEIFFEKISKKKGTKYNNQDGFFMPGAENKINAKALNYYKNEFVKNNKNGYNILKKIAQIPFSLIISVCPDDTLPRIFDKYRKDHETLSFNNKIQKPKQLPSKEKPIIYNLIGNMGANSSRYIFTHKQFYEYIETNQEVKIPQKIEKKIQDASHYLFLGIDFNKWSNRLLSFAMGVNAGVDSYSFNIESIKDINENFMNEQFNISFIDNNFDEFTSILLHKCKKANLYNSLIDIFIKKTLNDIKNLEDKTYDTDSFEKLSDIENEIFLILEQINKHI